MWADAGIASLVRGGVLRTMLAEVARVAKACRLGEPHLVTVISSRTSAALITVVQTHEGAEGAHRAWILIFP